MNCYTLQFINKYGSTLISMCRFEEAERLLRDVYLKRVESLTEDYPDTIMNLVNYVLELSFQNKLTEAQKLNVHGLYLAGKNKGGGQTRFCCFTTEASFS